MSFGPALRRGEIAAGPRATPPSACVVEDDALLCETVIEVLGDAGIVVVGAAPTLAEGRRLVFAAQPDLAVIDNALPDGRGIDLCVALRQAGLATVTILYSGLLTSEEAARASGAGAVVVMKSIRMQDLREAVERCFPPGRGEGAAS